ncbi:MAG TPA: hypothetical protein DCQ31_03295, partial [Bacteroidales bacterium]|nr:hypothetical protein [Bacteroidales bacterium]
PTFKEKWDTYEFINFKYGYLNNKYLVVSAGIVTDNVAVNSDGTKIISHTLSSLGHPLYGNSIRQSINLATMDFNRLDNYTFKSIFPDRKRTASPPNLIITNIVFTDTDKNNRLDAEESGKITFTVLNNGKGTSFNTKLQIFETTGLRGLLFEQEIALGDLAPDNNKSVTVAITAARDISTSQAKFAFQVSEAGGHKPEPANYTLATSEYVPPKLEIIAYEFATDAGGTIQKGQPVHLKVTLKNTGTGTAKGIHKTITNPVGVTEYNTGEIATMLASGESTTLHYVFMPTMRFAESEIGITASFSENSGNNEVKTLTVSMNQELLPYTSYDLVSDIDTDIPKIDESLIKKNRFAIIIGNEDYKSFQTGLNEEANVEYAAGDAIMFKKYAANLLGIPENNIRFKVNAKKTEMLQMISEVLALAKAVSGTQAEIYFYYAGHGFPHEVTKEPYIMPVDVSGANVAMGIKSADLYQQLVGGENVGKVSVFMDACFSGGGREQGLLAARAVKVKPVENPMINGNLVVFSASQGDQTALPFAEKNHGIFTYFLLKKLKESGGKLNYDEWSAYVKENVQETSVRVNKKPQDPKIITSSAIIETWQDWTTH